MRNHGHRRWSLGTGSLLVAAGLIAVAAPRVAAESLGLVVALTVTFTGLGHFILGRHSRDGGLALWELLAAMLYLVVGAFLFADRHDPLQSLTFGLGLCFFITGMFDMVSAAEVRARAGATRFSLDGVMSVAVAVMLWTSWPSDSERAIATLVGIGLVIAGVTRLTLPLRAS